MSVPELRDALKDTWPWKLPHPSGTGEMFCGRNAMIRLEAIADEVLCRNRLRGRISVPTMRDMLGPILVQRFLVERRPHR